MMMKKTILCSLALLAALLFTATSAVTANSCVKTFTVKGKDYKFDLNGLSSTKGIQAKGTDGYNYYISFCTNVDAPATSCPPGNYKGWQLSDDKEGCFPIAMAGDDLTIDLINPENAEGGLLVKMRTVDGSHNRGSEVQLTCKKKVKVGDVSVVEKPEGLYTSIYHFDMKSQYACIGGGGGSGRTCALGCVYGVGGLLMTLGLVGFILYFIVGFILCKFVWKKEGLEVIPNVAFWKDLPFLLKDGVMFWVDLFRKLTKKGEYTEVTA